MYVPNLYFNSEFAGAVAATTGGLWQLIIDDNALFFGQVSASVGNENVVTGGRYELTGFYYQKNGMAYYQTTGSRYIKWDDSAAIVAAAATSGGNAQSTIDKIIKNNKRILENNLICARFSHLLTAEQKDVLYGLQQRLLIRDNALRNNTLISSARESYPKGYMAEYGYLDSFMTAYEGTSAVPVLYIVVSAVVVASLSVAAYYAYKAYLTESIQDVEYSDELTKILTEKLSDEDFQMLKEETGGMITKAKIKGRFEASSGIVSLLGWGAAIFAAYKIFFDKKKN